MRWRPRQYEIEADAWSVPYGDERSPELVEVLLRLEAATRLRDPDAVARLLDRLSHTEDGMWLLHQCAAAGLREVAAQISAAPNQPGAVAPPIASIGAA